VALSALARVLGGTVAGDRLVSTGIALAGLVAAAAGPRLLVRGGPQETLDWTALPRPLATLTRLVSAVGVACAIAATAVLALGGRPGFPGGAALMAVCHATVIAGLSAGLAPRVGCSPATVLVVLLVAAGAWGGGAPGAVPAASPLPPGVAAVWLASGPDGRAALTLLGWGVVASLALWAPLPARRRSSA
jgi:hypothetical protein